MNERPASGSGLGPVGWLRGYPREWLRPDVVAGLTASAVVVPKAMAYATIAAAPRRARYRLVPMMIYVAGHLAPLSVSTTTTIAIPLGPRSSPPGWQCRADGSAATLAVMVGVVLMIASVLRLGFVADFISEPVLVGFKSGICLVIIVDQLPKLLGIHVDKTGFFRDVAHIVQSLPQLSILTVLVSLAVFALILGIERFVPRVPARSSPWGRIAGQRYLPAGGRCRDGRDGSARCRSSCAAARPGAADVPAAVAIAPMSLQKRLLRRVR
jgi:MFS superfamily sulfate permease-like transporter